LIPGRSPTQLAYFDRLIQAKAPKGAVLFYDRRLLGSPLVRAWIKSFEFSWALLAGEKLKSLDYFERAILRLQKYKSKISAPIQLWSLGGGTVGDFSGFVASVFHRGVPWIHIPSTWLSAIDSAHGGKTALNLGAKNQIGTYYLPLQVVLVKDLLLSQPESLRKDAWVEAFKISLLTSSALVKKTMLADTALSYWKLLPRWIEAKNNIVKKDPYEQLGIRSFLNLGHTMGHVFEKAFDLSHGEAVGLGLKFCLLWSYFRENERQKKLQKFSVSQKLPSDLIYAQYLRKILQRRGQLNKLLMKDKKLTSGKIGFVFLSRVGGPVLDWVTKEEIYFELKRQVCLFPSSGTAV
jgi:3-dehydroquinate synthetase